MQSVEEILRCYSKDRNPHHNRQIKFIIEQLNSSEWSHICVTHCITEAHTFRNTPYSKLLIHLIVDFFSAQVQGPESDTEVEEEYAVSPDMIRQRF